MKILIVEDEASGAIPQKLYLEEVGYIVDIADNAVDAIEMYEIGKYDFVITDIGLRDEKGRINEDLEGGYKVIQAINDFNKKTIRDFTDRIIVISGWIKEEEKLWKKIQAAGVKHIYKKPIHQNIILVILKNKGECSGR